MNQPHWNEAAVIGALAAVLAWVYPPFICFIGVGGVCATTFGGIALLELRETPARGLALARLGWYGGWINIAAYVYLMVGLVRQSVYGG
nr:hypothetical protein [uncultured Kingella sp.]